MLFTNPLTVFSHFIEIAFVPIVIPSTSTATSRFIYPSLEPAVILKSPNCEQVAVPPETLTHE